MRLVEKIARASVPGLIRFSCVLSLVGLAILMISIFVPGPLPVIFAMSLGHVVGGTAFACYVLAVILDTARREPPKTAGDTPEASHPG